MISPYPAGFGTTLSFGAQPDYMRAILQNHWALVPDSDQERIHRYLKDWEASGRKSQKENIVEVHLNHPDNSGGDCSCSD